MNLWTTSVHGYTMQAFGPVESTRIMRDNTTKMSRGFGFVTFLHNDSAVLAAQHMNGYPLFNRKLYVTPSKPGHTHAAMRSLNGMMPWASSSDQAAPHTAEAPMPPHRAFFQVNPMRKSLSLIGAV